MLKTLLLACGLSALLAAPVSAQKHDHGGKPWVHIEVAEGRGEGANVKVNLPLSLVEVAMEIAETEAFVEGDFELDGCDISVSQMRRMWDELRDAGDADFVIVEEDDERVHIYRKGHSLFIEVDDIDTREEKVRMEVPVSVVDALFDTDREDALNLSGALTELYETGNGEVLTVQDGDELVRIWID